ncbi:MAG: hypothetical protein WC979_01105 [Candidatus Pacearchaeota archaeon]|jgi:hypothetical protein|nr:hypothetical protein [Clostridia bacterium]
MELKKTLGYVIQDLTYKDEPVYIGANNVNVCKIRAAKLYVDEAHAKSELHDFVLDMQRLFKEKKYHIETHESEFAIIPIVVMPLENEILDSLKNLMGFIDTPIGRRKLGFTNGMLLESLKEAREIIEKYKV